MQHKRRIAIFVNKSFIKFDFTTFYLFFVKLCKTDSNSWFCVKTVQIKRFWSSG